MTSAKFFNLLAPPIFYSLALRQMASCGKKVGLRVSGVKGRVSRFLYIALGGREQKIG